MKRLVLLLTMGAAVMLAACGTFDVQADVVPVDVEDEGEKTPMLLGDDLADDVTEEAGQEPAEEPTDAADPAGANGGDVLPAPLYYLNADDAQVWRIEMDGVTTTQVTASETEIKEFSVSPTGEHVAYIAGNDMYLLGAGDDAAQMIVDGEAMRAPEAIDMPYIAFQEISRVRFSPDGSQLAYALGGVNIYQLSTGTSRMVYANDPLPGPDDTVESPPRMYMPAEWSPSGSRMVVISGIYFSDGGGAHVLDLASGELNDLHGGGGVACCQWAWAQDGGDVFVANDTPGLLSTGLWQADLQTGDYITLIEGLVDDTLTAFGAPYDAANGQVYGFMGSGPFSELADAGAVSVTMTSVSKSEGFAALPLREDSYAQGEAAWAPDGSGAAIVDISGRESVWPRVGTLRWLPLAGDAVELPADGSMLAWGAAGS